MSFIKANENFIRIKLGSEMKDLSESDKLEKYELIKEKCRSRISKYYDGIVANNANDKQDFYLSVIENFGFYDFNYILQNLFLDSHFITVFEYLKNNDRFESLLEKEKSNSSLARFILKFKERISRRISNYTNLENEFLNYLKEEIEAAISPENSDIWNAVKYNQHENSVIYKYSEHLIENVSRDNPYWDYTLYIHLLFLKIFNSITYFNDDNAPKKYILFINQLIRSYEKNREEKNIKLLKLQNKIKNRIHNSCFVEYNKTPVCITEEEARNISQGFANKIKDYQDLLNIRTVITDIENSSYFDLFMISDQLSANEFNRYLKQKIDTGSLITQHDIVCINNYLLENESFTSVKKILYKKFYVF